MANDGKFQNDSMLLQGAVLMNQTQCNLQKRRGRISSDELDIQAGS